MIAGLTRIVHDVVVAEELAQDALVAAFEQWPQAGIPQNPAAWLMATAKHRAIDYFRRKTLIERKHELFGRELAERESQIPDLAGAMDDGNRRRFVAAGIHRVSSRAFQRIPSGSYTAPAWRA